MVSQLLKSEFVGNVGKLVAGKGAVFFISLASIPIISRLYTPADYGVAGVFAAAISIAVIFFTLKYEPSVVLPDSDSEAQALCTGIIKMAFLAGVVMCLLIAPVRYLFAEQEIIQKLGNYVWLLPIAILFSVFSKVFDAWMSRKKQFAKIAISDVSMAGTNSAVRIGSGLLFGSTVIGLVFGLVMGFLAKVMVLLPKARKSIAKFGMAFQDEKKALLNYSEFPRYNMPADFVRTFVQNLPLLLFGIMYSATVAGLFFMAYRLTKVPLDLALASFRKVYLQKIASLKSADQPLQPAYLKSILGMALIGLIPALVLVFFGQEILTVMLGEKWFEAGRYAEIMAPLLWSAWVASPAAMFLMVLRKQNFWLYIQVLTAILQIGMFAYAYTTGQSVIWTLWAFVSIQFLINLVLNLLVYRLIVQSYHGEEALV